MPTARHVTVALLAVAACAGLTPSATAWSLRTSEPTSDRWTVYDDALVGRTSHAGDRVSFNVSIRPPEPAEYTWKFLDDVGLEPNPARRLFESVRIRLQGVDLGDLVPANSTTKPLFLMPDQWHEFEIEYKLRQDVADRLAETANQTGSHVDVRSWVTIERVKGRSDWIEQASFRIHHVLATSPLRFERLSRASSCSHPSSDAEWTGTRFALDQPVAVRARIVHAPNDAAVNITIDSFTSARAALFTSALREPQRFILPAGAHTLCYAVSPALGSDEELVVGIEHQGNQFAFEDLLRARDPTSESQTWDVRLAIAPILGSLAAAAVIGSWTRRRRRRKNPKRAAAARETGSEPEPVLRL